MNEYNYKYLKNAHAHTRNNFNEIISGEKFLCIYCKKIQKSEEYLINEHLILDESTLCCLNCGIDSVIGEKSGYPIFDIEFIETMNEYWFNGYTRK